MSAITEHAFSVANAIRDQIGLDVWLAISARTPRYWKDSDGTTTLAFRFGDRYGLPKWCEITYRPGSDDYAITAYKIHRNGVKRTLSIADPYEETGRDTADYSGVYADNLASLVRHINLIGELA